jgi:signal transduction histidine kinase
MKAVDFLKRHSLWAGFVAVVLPLLILMGLQYRWLVELDRTSSIVHEAELENFLEFVTDQVALAYRDDAERGLNLHATHFTQNRLEKAASHFKKKDVTVAKRLFVASFVNGQESRLLYFQPSCETFSPPAVSPEVQAAWVAIQPWKAQSYKSIPLERARLAVDERDANYPMILNPITDDSFRVVGIAGMILDEKKFQKVVHHEVERSLLKHFSGRRKDVPIVSVRDGLGRLAFATGPDRTGEGKLRQNEAEKHFSFVFTDWTISLASRHATPAVVARKNFLVNLGLSAVLGAVLLGGIVLALRAASRAMKLSEMKSDFVSNVSHELRTPLASIRVFGEFLRLGRVDSPEKAREYGDYIETESRRLTQLINNILDFASIESGRKNYKFERCDVCEVVRETLRTFEVRLRQNGFNIILEGADAALPPARLDAGAIAQSLSNLLDNAVKYSRDQKDITVALRREGDSVVISVRDHGIGIPRDEQRKIFDRFHRVPTGLVHDVKGSGLGLAIVRHIVEAHRGRVAVESRPGEGSTFSIHLPIELPGPMPLLGTPSREQPSGA